jgi:hypothetical protein
MNIDTSLAVGFASEAKVETALEILQKEPKRYGLKSMIKRFVRAGRHSRLDKSHVDFLVTLKEGTDVPLQVKSSERGRRKFERSCKRRGISIPVIVVHFGETVKSVIKQIVEKIKLVSNSIQRSINRIAFLNKVREEKRRRKEQHRQRQQECYRFQGSCMYH